MMDDMILHRKGMNQGDPFVDEIRTLELLMEFLEAEIDQWDEDDEDANLFDSPETLQMCIENFRDTF